MLAVLGCLTALPAAAIEIGVVGLFPGKAVLVVDNAAPKTYSVGAQVVDGVRLDAADNEGATLSIQGKRQVIPLGMHVNHAVPGAAGGVSLQAGSRGHYLTDGQINGRSLRLLVDTGATLIALPASEAQRLGIDYRRGQLTQVSTANGTISAWRVRLDTVRVGDLQLTQVDAVVQETGLPIALLGMSFLSRTDMNRSGELLTLTKRY